MKCGRCKERYPRKELIEWLDDLGMLSPHYCRDCYDYIVEHWEEGYGDIESQDWDDPDGSF